MATLIPISSYLDKRTANNPKFAPDLHADIDALRFGVSLCGLRELRGLTQEQLAVAAGLKQPMIGRYETGQLPNPDARVKLAQALGGYVLIEANGSIKIFPREERKDAA